MGREGTVWPPRQETLEKDDHVSDDGGRKGKAMDFFGRWERKGCAFPTASLKTNL